VRDSVKKHSVRVKKFFMLIFYAACGEAVVVLTVAVSVDIVADAVQLTYPRVGTGLRSRPPVAVASNAVETTC
jgi:hypothetical protein